MIKLLLYFFIIWALFRLWKLLSVPQGPRASGPASPGTGRIDGGELVQDPNCGVYIPKANAVKDRGGACFCSDACLEAYRKKRD